MRTQRLNLILNQSPQAAMAANGRIPRGAPVGRLLQVLAVGGAGVYGLANSLFNVEGGHRAIVFNRIIGIKDQVRRC